MINPQQEPTDERPLSDRALRILEMIALPLAIVFCLAMVTLINLLSGY